ncbi:hypothetical protein Back11_44550 [Paenibacillus baekrokdamisoli]|uniref:Uncharacterized protein n=1 Tax=Paenibacillus baekrokdamisoli TaxID=1712516 RepID=A0A3G9IW86_9BACL|nr:hypothetical protein Back11_44550 [Paenibacillus baekrokdamisoli]
MHYQNTHYQEWRGKGITLTLKEMYLAFISQMRTQNNFSLHRQKPDLTPHAVGLFMVEAREIILLDAYLQYS